MSADTNPASAPQPAAAEPPSIHEPIRPRKVQPVRRDDEDEAPPAAATLEAQLRALAVQLQAILGQGRAAAAAPPPEAPPSEAGVTSKNRRFAAKSHAPPPAPAKSPLPAAFETEDQTAEPSDAAPETVSVPADLRKADTRAPAASHAKVAPAGDKPPVEEAFAEQRRLRHERDRQRLIRNIVLGGLLLVAISFAAGWLTASLRPLQTIAPRASASVDPKASARADVAGVPGWPRAALVRLDDILRNDQAGKIDDAFQAATTLRKDFGALAGLNLYLGNLDARRRFYNDANGMVASVADADVPPAVYAAACDQLGFIYGRQRVFARAADYFSQAAASDPFNGEYYYHWAEALRRRGKQAQSLAVFEQALARVPLSSENVSLHECAALKMRLAIIELGQGAQLQPELDEHLKAPSPSGYWLLTSAALALQEGRFPAAAEALQKAKAALTPLQYEELASDYFFRAFAGKTELGRLLPAASLEQEAARRQSGAYFIDP